MIDRCYGKSPQHKTYRNNSIEVCSEWRKPEPFIEWALSHGYDDSLQIDRIDNEGHYTPDNCRFVTATVNTNNRKNTRYLNFQGRQQSVSQWANELGMGVSTLFERLAHGWCIAKALRTPVAKKQRRGNERIRQGKG
jgi:hypothetical protein